MSRIEFWQEIFIAAIRAGKACGHAVQDADYAVTQYDERQMRLSGQEIANDQ